MRGKKSVEWVGVHRAGTDCGRQVQFRARVVAFHWKSGLFIVAVVGFLECGLIQKNALESIAGRLIRVSLRPCLPTLKWIAFRYESVENSEGDVIERKCT